MVWLGESLIGGRPGLERTLPSTTGTVSSSVLSLVTRTPWGVICRCSGEFVGGAEEDVNGRRSSEPPTLIFSAGDVLSLYGLSSEWRQLNVFEGCADMEAKLEGKSWRCAGGGLLVGIEER
mmetsp:Transcript_23260/g.48335  ORF Transcript_23260/g.48335 Transcript_23260/m.48335 type:complete len:121 (-) Transcript_23260:147-509(-)